MCYNTGIKGRDNMKILCYGDSNTYGHNPIDGSRLKIRWTNALQKSLGADYEIFEEGLCGRTTVFDDAFTDGLNGRKLLEPILRTHQPLDLVILMLGTNDMQIQFNASAYDIARGVETLIKIVKNPCIYAGKVPEILVVSPTRTNKGMDNNEYFSNIFGTERSMKISGELAGYIKSVADNNGAYFLNAADYAEASDLDGLHLNEENHILLSRAIEDKIHEIEEDMNK